MTIYSLLIFVLALSVLELLLNERHPALGSAFAVFVAIFGMLLHPAFFFSGVALLALQFFLLSLRERLALRLTDEARRRQSYREICYLSYREHLRRSIRVPH